MWLHGGDTTQGEHNLYKDVDLPSGKIKPFVSSCLYLGDVDVGCGKQITMKGLGLYSQTFKIE